MVTGGPPFPSRIRLQDSILLEGIMRRRTPELAGLLDRPVESWSRECLQAVRKQLGREIFEYGYDSENNLTQYGEAVEELAARLPDY